MSRRIEWSAFSTASTGLTTSAVAISQCMELFRTYIRYCSSLPESDADEQVSVAVLVLVHDSGRPK